MQNNGLIRIAVIFFLVVALIGFFSNSIFLTIQPGEKGIIFQRFSGGLDKENIYSQGFHVIAPWNRMIIYSVREEQMEEKMDVLSSNGLSITVDISTRFHPTYKALGDLHDEFGVNYKSSLVVPEVRSAVREVVGRFSPEELYSTKRSEVEQAIFDKVTSSLSDNHIELKALLIRSVTLPTTISDAIERKLEQEQQSKEYEFRLIREQKEAQRKEIEAEGIKRFQDIVSQGISKNYLQWKGIEATQELANSTNTKVVVIGNSDDGLPLILGGAN